MKKKYRKRAASSSDDEESEQIQPIPAHVSKKVQKRGVSAGELLKKDPKPPSPTINRDEQFGGLVLPEDYKKKLEVVGIIKTETQKKDELEMYYSFM
jgi:hypothetical protein